MKTLLLTGWTWYIGSHNAVLFLQQWYDVILFDNLSNSSKDVVEKIQRIVASSPLDNGGIEKGVLKFYKWDLRNIDDIQQVFSENTIDAVIHFAGLKAVWESCEKPYEYYENNVIWSNNLFQVMENNNCKNILFSSSANVYGMHWKSPLTESHDAGNTSNPYGTTKYIIERILRDLHYNNDFNVLILRYFNPVWAHPSWLIGEHANQQLGNILPFLLKVASWKQETIQVFWNDYDTIDGTWVRDYIHVMDLAQWHVAACEYLQKQVDYNIINLGTWTGTSVLQLIDIVKNVTQKEIPYEFTSRRSIDIDIAYCSAEKAEKVLWWKSQKTVKQAVADSWKFITIQQWK